jgi:hypothetical protein
MASSKSRVPAPVLLPRTTNWSAERVAALPQLLEVRQLLANAERLGETALAGICTADIARRRREALKAPKPAGAKPKAKKPVAEEA